MKNWELLSNAEHEKAKDFIYDKLYFKPYKEEMKVIVLPAPNKCHNISHFYNDGFNEELYNDLHASAINWFKHISKGERMFALNWQHESYSFNPELPFELDEFNEWLISVFPNGDYLFFLTKDFKNGIFADGIHFSFCLFGKDILEAFEISKPSMLIGNC